GRASSSGCSRALSPNGAILWKRGTSPSCRIPGIMQWKTVLTLAAAAQLAAAAVLTAGQAPRWTTPSAAEIDAIYPDMAALYRDLHQHPELAFQETRTAATLAAHLKALGFEVTTGVGRTGLVGVLR